MKKLSFVSAVLGMTLFGAASASETVTVYYSPSCPYCHYARNDLADKLIYEYPNLSVTEVDVSNPDNHPAFTETLKKCGLKSGGVPVIVFGDNCKQGYSGILADDIRGWLDSTLNEEQKTLVATNRRAMETDAEGFKARNAARKNAIVQHVPKKVKDTKQRTVSDRQSAVK